MNKIGFIGNECLSSRLVEKFLLAGKVHSSEIIVSERVKEQSESARTGWNEIKAVSDNPEVVKAAKYIFLCADPSEAREVLEEIKDCVSEDKNLISTGIPSDINLMASIADYKVTRLAPTMISENGKRISVICHSRKVKEDEAEYIESLLCETCNARVYKATRF